MRAGILSGLVWFAILASTHVNAGGSPGGKDYFLLYSWKITGGEYDFALVPIGREKAFLAGFKPARSGVGGPSRLKAILATLPSRSLIVWEEASDVGLELPPAQNVDDVVSFARTKNIRVELNPALNETSDISTTAALQTLASNAERQTPDDSPRNPSSQYSAVNNQLSPTEQKIVGAWSWTYIEGVGRIVFTADHKVRAGFPPDDKDGRRIGDEEFDIVQAGTWRLEGEVLITEMDNSPLINILAHLDPSNRPALEKKVERRKIVKIDGNKIVFDDGYSFDRVLLERIAPAKGHKRHNAKSSSSTTAALTARKQGRRQSDAGVTSKSPRTLALVTSATEPRLGSSINEFRSAWGSPIREEMLVRTATLVWRAPGQSNEAFPTGIFEAEVSFLDQIACGIVLRSKRPATPDKTVRLAQPILPRFCAADFAKPRSEVNGIRVYDLEDGTSVSVKQHEGRMVIVIRSPLFFENSELFDREAAKVRPPTSNH